MTKTEREQLSDAIRKAQQAGNLMDRMMVLEAALLAYLSEGGRS